MSPFFNERPLHLQRVGVKLAIPYQTFHRKCRGGSCEKCAYTDEGCGVGSSGEKTQFLQYVTLLLCVLTL